MNFQDVSHIRIPDGDVRMIHDSDNRLLWGAVGYNVLFSGDTFQQTYTGKNLLGLKKPSSNTFGFEPVVAEESGTITVDGTFTGGGGGYPWISDRQLSIPAGTYTFSMKTPQSFNVSLRMFDAQGQYTSGKYIAAGATSGTFTLDYDCVRVAILIGAFSTGKTLNNQKFEELQLEAGSTASNFEPYVGAQPSPNPDYPQQIQTVTGEQTVSINGTDYPISLGSLELCKIGTYQDYIYKDGDDWKVHKATVSAIIDGSESWSASGTNKFYVANIYSKIGNSIQSTSTGGMYASHFTIVDISSSNTLVGASLKVDAAQNLSNLRIRLQDMSGSTAGFRQMLSAKKPSIYARRLTPTDTTITDANLIAQLEAIYNLVRRYGYNFVVSASGNNLPIIIDRTLL